ncbi:MAG TPA: hypothetical protein VII97_07630 [Anaerolineales bacterium]
MEIGIGFEASDEQCSQIKALLSSLDEALRVLEADYEFMTSGGVFTKELLKQRIDLKCNQEYFAVQNRPHPYEMNLYFDV